MHQRLKLRLAAVVLLSCALSLAGCTADSTGPTDEPTATVELSTPTSTVVPTATVPPLVTPPMTFAVIGDYGTDDRNARAVARLVASWDPAFIITTGDNYYWVAGGKGTGRYDESTGAHYSRWLKDISTTGDRRPEGRARVNAFFPSLGNHDYSDALPSLRTYRTYFRLPGSGFKSTSGNERYYDFVQGQVHFFALNSNPDEPDGITKDSEQARWLKRQLAATTSRWNVVYDHHPPYSSDRTHGSFEPMRWPFAGWGADVVLSGHAHVYERLVRDGFPYFVNGLGGASRYAFDDPVEGSKVRYRSDWGAQKVIVSDLGMTFEFYNVEGERIDRYTVRPRE